MQQLSAFCHSSALAAEQLLNANIWSISASTAAGFMVRLLEHLLYHLPGIKSCLAFAIASSIRLFYQTGDPLCPIHLPLYNLQTPCAKAFGNTVARVQARQVRQSAAENLGELTRMSMRVDQLATDLINNAKLADPAIQEAYLTALRGMLLSTGQRLSPSVLSKAGEALQSMMSSAGMPQLYPYAVSLRYLLLSCCCCFCPMHLSSASDSCLTTNFICGLSYKCQSSFSDVHFCNTLMAQLQCCSYVLQ